jgi:prepilin-type N-terminal cleavage/methylation domain-containing protein
MLALKTICTNPTSKWASKREVHPPPVRLGGQGGYSLLELAVVVAILSVIAALSIPNIFKWIAISRIDAVKTLLNSAASECLQDIRSGQDPQAISPPDSTISNENLGSYGYQIKSTDSKCGSFFAVPANEGETFLYELGFKISAAGDIVKIAVPASDTGSLNSCKNWAGVNCGVSAEQQSIWDALARIEASKKACNDDFYTWLQKPSSGSFNRWDETTKSCTLTTWAFEGSIQRDEQAVKDARSAKLGALCTAKLKAKADEKPPFDGPFTDPDCGTTYFCSGKDLATDSKTAYDACKEQERQTKCTAALGLWKTNGINGQFNESGCTAMWQCNRIPYTTQADYDASDCGCTWVEEQYQTGTEPKQVQTGSSSRQVCAATVFGRCTSYRTEMTPIYETLQVPVYGTRKVCKKL